MKSVIRDCKGRETKNDIIENHIVYPVTQLMLLSGQKKSGCCGELTKQYFLFGFSERSENDKKGSFYVGSDCAKQFIAALNERQRRIGTSRNQPYRITTAPPLFNPFVENRAVYPQNTYNTNREMIDAIHLLMTFWDTPTYGTLLYIITGLLHHPERAVSEKSVIFLNHIIGKDRLVQSGVCHTFAERIEIEERRLGKSFAPFDFAALKSIVANAVVRGEAQYNRFGD